MNQSTPAVSTPDAARENTAAPIGSRRMRLAIAALAVAAVAAWFLPAILARTGFRHQIVHLVFPEYPGDVAIDRAALSWFSPVVLHGVRLDDIDGQELAQIERLTTSQTLSGLLFGSGRDYGTFTLDKPQVIAQLRSGGSNLEDALRPLFDTDDEGAGTGWVLVINDGEIRWTMADGTSSQNALTEIEGTIHQQADHSFPERIELAARCSDGERSGTVKLQLAPVSDGVPEGVIKAEELPLTALQPWLDRFESSLQVSGILSIDMVGRSPQSKSGGWTVTGALDGHMLRIASSAFEQAPLLLEALKFRVDALVDDQQITLRDANLTCDIGTATAAGEIPYAALLQTSSPIDRLTRLLEQRLEVTADIDIATLATGPLSMGGAIPMTSGRAQLTAHSFQADGDPAGSLTVQFDDLVAGTADRPIVWRDPFTLKAQIRRDDNGLHVDHLEAKAEFLTISGSGDAGDAEARFDADLDKLRQKLSQFMAIPEGLLAGRASGTLHARRSGKSDEVVIEAGTTFHDLSLQLAGRRWIEKELTATLNCLGQAEGTSLDEITNARLTLHSVEGDELTIDIPEPVSLAGEGRWLLSITAQGEITRWLDRLRTWGLVGVEVPWNAAGHVDVAASVDAGPANVAVHDLVVDAQQLKLQLGGRVVEEPRVRLTGHADWDVASQTLALSEARLLSETATINANRLSLPLGGDRPASGDLTFRAGIGRVARYALSERPPVWLSGVAAGTLSLRHNAATTEIESTIDLERPTLSRPTTDASGRSGWQPLWSDDHAKVVVNGRFEHASSTLALSTFRATGSGLAIDVQGQIDRPALDAIANLSGTLTYEWETLSQRLAGAGPAGLVARGRGSRPFTLRGPLASATTIVDPQLTATAGLDWRSIDLWGIPIDAGELALGLQKQVLSTAPFEWVAAGGKARGRAAVSLKERPILTIAPGRLVDTVVLTPEISRQWLQFAAPAMAESTVVEGSVSFDVQNCRVPVDDPTAAAAQGVLVVHRATASPGPFAESLLGVLNQIRAISGSGEANDRNLRLIAPEQNVTIRVANGRVIHDRFTVRIGSADGPMISTSGSVGFDQTLDLVAEIPLDSKWFKNKSVAALFGSQTLRVPIGGTLSRPVPEPRVLQELGRKAATDAVGGFLEQELDKQIGDPLRKLFERK